MMDEHDTEQLMAHFRRWTDWRPTLLENREPTLYLIDGRMMTFTERADYWREGCGTLPAGTTREVEG